MDIRNGGPGGFSGLDLNDRAGATGPDDNRALVVAASPINRIVIAHTLEKIYLKPDAVTPHEALATLRVSQPILAIVDDSGAGDTLGALLKELTGRNMSSERGLPRIILIGDGAGPDSAPPEHAVDAVISRPFSPDTLQPVVERVVAVIRAC